MTPPGGTSRAVRDAALVAGTGILAMAPLAVFANFGVHLLLLGFLAFRSGYVPRVLGALLALAGLGYLVDSLGAFLSSGYSTEVAVFTGVGELVLMIWLLTKGRNIGSRLPIQAEPAP